MEFHFQFLEKLALVQGKYVNHLTIQYSFDLSLILSFSVFFFLVHN